MASGDVWSVLEECVKKINANTAQPENFLRQVFAVCTGALLKNLFNVVAASLTQQKKRKGSTSSPLAKAKTASSVSIVFGQLSVSLLVTLRIVWEDVFFFFYQVAVLQ